MLSFNWEYSYFCGNADASLDIGCSSGTVSGNLCTDGIAQCEGNYTSEYSSSRVENFSIANADTGLTTSCTVGPSIHTAHSTFFIPRKGQVFLSRKILSQAVPVSLLKLM